MSKKGPEVRAIHDGEPIAHSGYEVPDSVIILGRNNLLDADELKHIRDIDLAGRPFDTLTRMVGSGKKSVKKK